MTDRPYRMRDPIHGLIEISEKEKALIDTPVFQRLRRIRQLAMAFLVYPAALHTRFEHSVGVMHIVGRICSRLKEFGYDNINDLDIDLMRFAALIHDVGHGPFSHVSEDIFEKYVPNQDPTGETREKMHEQITSDIIEIDSDIKRILNDDERDFVIKLIKEKDMGDWRRNIISSELDADKMDYLLRDSYFAGVKYGQYDLEQIIESCRIDKDRGITAFVISDRGIYALEQLLLARYHMTKQVYWHRVSLISNQMIIRGITLAIKDNDLQMKRLYQYDENNKENFIQSYLNYDDGKVIDILRCCADEKAREIFDRLYHRRLFKMVAELSLKNGDHRIALRLLRMDRLEKKQWTQKAEKEIAKYLGIEAEDVIIYRHQIRNSDYGSRSKILDPETIQILDEKHNELKKIEYYASELSFVRSAPEDISPETFHVYASPDGWATSRKQTPELEADIQEILCTV